MKAALEQFHCVYDEIGIGIMLKRYRPSKQRLKTISFYGIMFALEAIVILLLIQFFVILIKREMRLSLPSYNDYAQYDPAREGGHLLPNLDIMIQGERRNRAVRLITNSKGFRNQKEFSYAVPQGTYRILFMGDSFVDGLRTDQTNTIGYILEDYLNEHNLDSQYTDFEVMISGHNNPARAWYNYQEYGYKYQPQLVILGVTLGNDFTWSDYKYTLIPQHTADNGTTLTLDTTGSYPSRGKKDLILPPQAFRTDSQLKWSDKLELTVRDLLERVFYSLGYLMPPPTSPYPSSWGHVYAAGSAHSFGLFYQPLMPEFEQFYTDTEEVLVGFSQAVNRYDTNFLVVFFPTRIQVSEEDWKLAQRFYGFAEQAFDLDYPNKRLAHLCEAYDIDCLDVTPAYRDYERQNSIRIYRTRGDMHINEAGQALSGIEIGKHVLGIYLDDEVEFPFQSEN